MFFTTMMFFGCNLSNVNPIKCIAMNNQECKVRPEIVDDSDETCIFLF